MSVTLSLLMPTRNRAEYLSAGVGFFLDTAEADVELIVCDASDNHAACLVALAPWLSDGRLVVIDNTVASTGRLSSMAENWSRALDAANGRWLTIIGDDDVCDPAVVSFLQKFEHLAPQCEVVTWHRAHFDIGIDMPREAKIPMGTKIMLAAGRESVLKQSEWPNDKRPPTSIASPYHGAVTRNALLRLKNERGAWFRFAIPDYDLGWSIAWQTPQFAICERPFSITGVSPKSNSYSVRNEAIRVEYLDNWQRESKVLDGWGETNDPFLFSLPLTVLGFRNAFCEAVGIKTGFSHVNFVSTVKNSLQNQEDQTSFDQHKRAAAIFFTQQFGEDFGIMALEKMVRPREPMAGLVGDLLISPNALFEGDISRFAKIAFGMVRPVNYLFANR